MEHKLNIKVLPAFGDNYIYVVKYNENRCFVIDPGQADIVINEISKQGLSLTHILLTHHHQDHIGGVNQLKAHTDCEVISSDKQRIGKTDTIIGDSEIFDIEGIKIRCIWTPGHTSTSVCYHVTEGEISVPVLFSGDTLFVCGCGRMFECDAQTMFESLQKITTLPDQTEIYPGHDYTEENIRFALTLSPESQQLQKKLSEVQDNISLNRVTVPSTLNEEKMLNPFLTAGNSQRFAQIRRQKDVF